MFAAYRTRKIFRSGGLTYEQAEVIRKRKSMEMVNYLRARRSISRPEPSTFKSYALENKRFARREFLRTRRRERYEPTELRQELEAAEANVDNIRRQIASASCLAVGHDWKHIGGCNAGCQLDKDCCCSVPVHQCTKCGDCDYGDNPEADEKRAHCNNGESPDGL